MTKDERNALKAKNDKELTAMLKEYEEKLRSLRFDFLAGKVKNVSSMRTMKKDIARLHTALRAHTLA
jgi:ribosomal protein L29